MPPSGSLTKRDPNVPQRPVGVALRGKWPYVGWYYQGERCGEGSGLKRQKQHFSLETSTPVPSSAPGTAGLPTSCPRREEALAVKASKGRVAL